MQKFCNFVVPTVAYLILVAPLSAQPYCTANGCYDQDWFYGFVDDYLYAETGGVNGRFDLYFVCDGNVLDPDIAVDLGPTFRFRFPSDGLFANGDVALRFYRASDYTPIEAWIDSSGFYDEFDPAALYLEADARLLSAMRRYHRVEVTLYQYSLEDRQAPVLDRISLMGFTASYRETCEL